MEASDSDPEPTPFDDEDSAAEKLKRKAAANVEKPAAMRR